MKLKKRIIDEPVYLIREAARRTMKGRFKVLFLSSALYMFCLLLPVTIVEQIMGLWAVLERALEDYIEILLGIDLTALDSEETAFNTVFTALQPWAETYAGKLDFSFASFIYILLVPGPLTLGMSHIGLHIIRGKDVSADMIFSGFGDFTRVVAMDTVRRVFVLVWSLLMIIPGVIAYYRFNLAFFLIADNPKMKSYEALSLSKYYMEKNKGSRFSLDLSLIGWFAVSIAAFYILEGLTITLLISSGYEATLFSQFFISSLTGSVVFAPICAYRGICAAEYYHRVICRDPKSNPGTLELPKF